MPVILFAALVALLWLITAVAVCCVMVGGKPRPRPEGCGRVAGGDASH